MTSLSDSEQMNKCEEAKGAIKGTGIFFMIIILFFVGAFAFLIFSDMQLKTYLEKINKMNVRPLIAI